MFNAFEFEVAAEAWAVAAAAAEFLHDFFVIFSMVVETLLLLLLLFFFFNNNEEEDEDDGCDFLLFDVFVVTVVGAVAFVAAAVFDGVEEVLCIGEFSSAQTEIGIGREMDVLIVVEKLPPLHAIKSVFLSDSLFISISFSLFFPLLFFFYNSISLFSTYFFFYDEFFNFFFRVQRKTEIQLNFSIYIN